MNPQRLSRAVAACAALCLGVAAGCSSSTSDQKPAALDLSPSTGGSPQQQATAAQHALLAAFASIPGAHVADAPNFMPGQAYESWKLGTAAAAGFSAAVARLPRWPKTDGGGGAGGQYTETVQTSGAGTLAKEVVMITVVPDGATASTLQVNVEADYRVPRPEAERVPDSAVLEVTLRPVSAQGTPGAATTETITSRSTIAQIASDLNALPTAAFGPAYACPNIGLETTLTLDFEPAVNAPASASTVVQVPIRPTGICTPALRVTVDGTVQPVLDDSMHAGLFGQIEQLAGITR